MIRYLGASSTCKNQCAQARFADRQQDAVFSGFKAPNVGCHGLANRETPEILCKSSTTTLPEPDVAPENWWLGDHFPFWGPACFQGKLLVSGRVYKSSVATTEPPTCHQSSEASGSVENTPGNLSESNNRFR